MSSAPRFRARKEPDLTAESTRIRAARADSALTAATLDALPDTLAWRSINTVRALAMDAVEAAQSGHPGTPMALAPAAFVLWHRFLRFNPSNPAWPDRDRFVLSCGHASLLLYSLLHLTGYDLSLEDIKAFRQWGRRPPGTPSGDTRRAWRPPPARSGRAWGTRSGWRSPSGCSPTISTGRGTGSSITAPGRSPATAI